MEQPASRSSENPRVLRTRTAILAAAVEILISGGSKNLTVDAVMAKTKVARATVYRHWSSRDELLADAFLAARLPMPTPSLDRGFDHALAMLLRTAADRMNADAYVAQYVSLAEVALSEPAVYQAANEFRIRNTAVAEPVIRLGVDEGVLRPDLDVAAASAVLLGPLFFAAMNTPTKITDALLADAERAFRLTFGRS